jgi:hypothetical protein
VPLTLDDILNFIDREEPEYGAAAAVGDAALPFLADLVTGDDQARATKSASLAGVIGTPGAAQVLNRAAQHANAGVRVAAAAGGRPMAPELVAEMLGRLAEDPDVGVRRVARSVRNEHLQMATLAFVDWRTADALGATGVLHGHDVTLTGTMGTAFYLDGNYPGFDSDAFSPRLPAADMVEISARDDRTFTLSFGTPVEDVLLHLGSLGSTLTFDPGTEAAKVSGTAGFSAAGNVVSGAPLETPGDPSGPHDANGTARLSGAFTLITFSTTVNYPAPGIVDGILLQVGGLASA